MGAFFVLLFTAAVYAFAGCPDPEKGVTHPDLGKVLRELDGDYGDAAAKVKRALPSAPKPLPKRSYRDEIGGGSI